MKPMVEVVQRMLNGQAERYGKVVDALPEDALNWRPGNEETNSVAQLVRHVTAVQNVLLGRALGESPEHDHAHSLRNDPATKEELHGLIAAAKAQKDDQLARLDGMDMSENAARPARPHAPRALRHPHRRPRAGASRPRRTDEAVVGAARLIRTDQSRRGCMDDTVPAHGERSEPCSHRTNRTAGNRHCRDTVCRPAAQPPYAAYGGPVPPYGYYDTPAYVCAWQAPPATQTSSFAIASLVCSLASWIVIPFVGAVAAVVLGHIARHEIRHSYGQKSGNGLAMAGLVIGYIQIALSIVVVFFFLLLLSRLRLRISHIVGPSCRATYRADGTLEHHTF